MSDVKSNNPVIITQEVANRIANTVTGFERLTKGGHTNLQRPYVAPGLGFWAQIDDSDGSGAYSWTQCSFDEDGSCSEDSSLQTASYSDDNCAYEVRGADYVLNQSIVWLMPSVTQPYMIFEYIGGTYNGTISGDISSSGTVTVTLDDGSTTQDITAYNNLGVTVSYANGSQVMVAYGQEAKWWIIAQTCTGTSGYSGSGIIILGAAKSYAAKRYNSSYSGYSGYRGG